MHCSLFGAKRDKTHSGQKGTNFYFSNMALRKVVRNSLRDDCKVPKVLIKMVFKYMGLCAECHEIANVSRCNRWNCKTPQWRVCRWCGVYCTYCQGLAHVSCGKCSSILSGMTLRCKSSIFLNPRWRLACLGFLIL